jgi:hypothetical protein
MSEGNETISQWAARVDPSTQTCFFKFVYGRTVLPFDGRRERITVKTIPSQVVSWLIENFPVLIIDTSMFDTMMSTGAEFKSLPVGACVAEFITYKSFLEELDALVLDNTQHIEDSQPDIRKISEPLRALNIKANTTKIINKFINRYFEVRKQISEEWFAVTQPEPETLSSQETIDRLFGDEENQEEHSDDEYRQDLTYGFEYRRKTDSLFNSFHNPDISTFEAFRDSERSLAAKKHKDMLPTDAVRHELPEGWLKGMVGIQKYYYNETNDTFSYLPPDVEPTERELKAIKDDPECLNIRSKIVEAFNHLVTVLTGEASGLTNPSIIEQLTFLQNINLDDYWSQKVTDAARQRYEAEKTRVADLKAKVKAEIDAKRKEDEKEDAKYGDKAFLNISKLRTYIQEEQKKQEERNLKKQETPRSVAIDEYINTVLKKSGLKT